MDRLKKKVALVTGAGSGIGRAIARLFAKEEAKVVVVDIDPKGGTETVRLIEEAGGDAVFVEADVSNAKDAERMVKVSVDAYGKLDVLVNNAGINPSGTVVDTQEKTWDEVFNVNVKGIFLGSKYAIPEMTKNGRGGIIINTASVAGLVGTGNEIAYCASKGAVVAMTKGMAIDHADQNIHVNCICPAGVDTPLHDRYLASVKDPEMALQQLVNMTLLKRIAKPEEIDRKSVV